MSAPTEEERTIEREVIKLMKVGPILTCKELFQVASVTEAMLDLSQEVDLYQKAFDACERDLHAAREGLQLYAAKIRAWEARWNKAMHYKRTYTGNHITGAELERIETLHPIPEEPGK